MLQHYFHMSYAYYKFDNQRYCIQHTLLNNFSYCLLHFTNSILHNIAIRPLIHMGLSDNPAQKNYLSKTIYMHKVMCTAIFNVRGRGLSNLRLFANIFVCTRFGLIYYP